MTNNKLSRIFNMVLVSVLLLIATVALPMLSSCDEDEGKSSNNNSTTTYTENPKIRITMADGKIINLVLYPKVAPITVDNFIKLVDEQYYDGLIFHRIIGNFMIQGGGYSYDGTNITSAPSRTAIKGEFSSNGVTNTLSHDAGVISMARTNVKDSATGQFFICTNGNNKSSLDGNYAAFGKVTDYDSMQAVLEIASVETGYFKGMNDFPIENVPQIRTIRRIS